MDNMKKYEALLLRIFNLKKRRLLLFERYDMRIKVPMLSIYLTNFTEMEKNISRQIKSIGNSKIVSRSRLVKIQRIADDFTKLIIRSEKLIQNADDNIKNRLYNRIHGLKSKVRSSSTSSKQ